MAAPASEGHWRRRWRWDDDDEPRRVGEAGEAVPGGGYHSASETDTEEYYNRHPPNESDDEAVVSGHRGATAVVFPANTGGNAASTSCVARGWGWGGTGKRGRAASLGTGRAVSSRAEPEPEPADHQPMAVVAAAAPKAVLQPVPLAFAPPPSSLPLTSVRTASAAGTNLSGESSSSRAESVPVHNDAAAMETVAAVAVAVAGAAASAAPAAVHPEPVAPPPAASRPAPAAGRQNPGGYTCAKCGMWFATHQGLGGHSVGHKHRERELLAAGPGGRDGAKRERVHVCGDCGAEFATGVQLGGHKRKHWAGAPIVPKKKPRAVVQPPPLPAGAGPARAAGLLLPIETDEAAPPSQAVETNAQPATRSPVPGRVRLFGVDIVPAVQTPPPPQQGSPASATKSSGDSIPAGSSSHSP